MTELTDDQCTILILRGQVTDLERDLAAANARVAELAPYARGLELHSHKMLEHVNAANARVAELEASEKQAREMSVSARMALKEDGEMQDLLDAANLRAEVNERAWDAARERADAANARVTELEAQARLSRDSGYRIELENRCRELGDSVSKFEQETVPGLCRDLDAANARAEAAERESRGMQEMWRLQSERAAVAESECDEWKAKCEAAVRAIGELNNAWHVETMRKLAAESEAASLRAELEVATGKKEFLYAELERVTMLARTTAAAADVLRAKAIERRADHERAVLAAAGEYAQEPTDQHRRDALLSAARLEPTRTDHEKEGKNNDGPET